MFTGIISHLGKLEAIKRSRYTFSADSSFFTKLGKGGSIAVNGICLTLIAKPNTKTFSVEVMPETLKKTMMGRLQVGDYVNLELPVSPSDLFAGHLVQGHVDGTAILTAIEPEGNSQILRFSVQKNLSRYMIDKGSVAVNGISLTIIEAGKDFFTVGIIPHTWKNTMLQYSSIGDPVNIEIDIIAKYVEKFVSL